jgi:hypothetical protein
MPGRIGKCTHDFDVLQDAASLAKLLKGPVVGGLLPDSLTHNLEMGASSGEPERTPDEDEIEGEEAHSGSRTRPHLRGSVLCWELLQISWQTTR